MSHTVTIKLSPESAICYKTVYENCAFGQIADGGRLSASHKGQTTLFLKQRSSDNRNTPRPTIFKAEMLPSVTMQER